MQHDTIRRARAMIAKLDGIEHVFAKRSQRDSFAEDALASWRRGMPASERPSREKKPYPADIEMKRVRQWKNFIDGRIAAAIERNNAIRLESTGRALGEIRKQLRQEIDQLRADITKRSHNG